MIHRTMCLVLLLASQSWGGGPLLYPQGAWVSISVAADDVLYCTRVPAPQGGSFTKLAARVTAGVASDVCGIGIYPDSDGGTALGTVNAACTAAANISGTGLSISLTAGVVYRLCYCALTAAGVNWVGARELVTSSINRTHQLRNAVTLGHGTAFQGCSGGVPPSTTGALTATVTVGTVQLLLE